MSFPKYTKYKDSGLEWVGELPAHWTVARMKWVAKMESGHTPDKKIEKYWENCEIPWVSLNDTGHLKDNDYISDTAFQVNELGIANSSARLLPARVVVFSRDATIGRCAITTRPMAVSQHFIAWVCGESIIPEYLLMCLRSMTQELDRLTTGATLKTIGMPHVRTLATPVPPLDEQQTIIEFVAAETTKLDSLVDEQRRLIELLKEKRQAVISRAVIKGLNLHSPMKPSGIEWLGDVPEHWTTPPVYLRYEAVLGKMLNESRISGTHPIPYLRNADVQWDYINTDDLPIFDIEPDEFDRFTLRSGDILICEGGAGVGQTAIWRGDLDRCAFQKALHRLRPLSSNENPRFFCYCMRFAVDTGIVLASGTATIPHLTGEKLRGYRFPRPPFEEQVAIVEFLDAEAAKLDALTDEALRAIGLLQERRTTLISAAVTGKIDVRGMAESEAA